jgi:hypothetical protein
MNRPRDHASGALRQPAGLRPPWSGERDLRAFLGHAARRLAWIAAGEGAAAGLLVAIAVAVAGLLGGGPLVPPLLAAPVLMVAGIGARLIATMRRRRAVAIAIERGAPECRNVIITAAELLDRPGRVQPYIGNRVTADAARIAAALDPAALFPAQRVITALMVCVSFWAFAVTRADARTDSTGTPLPVAIGSVDISGIDAVITPPAYAGQASRTLSDPARIVALAGSRIELSVRAVAATVTASTADGSRTLDRAGDTFSGELPVEADGFIAIEPAASDGRAGVRRLIGVTATPDASPRVRVTEPARDLFLPDADRTIDVAIEADDDLALASLTLRFTKVSGSGEQFTFTDGELPLQIVRSGERNWTGRTVLRLDTLGLLQGDVLVYRGVAADRRPGAQPAESDAFVIELTSPGAIAADGFAIDDEQGRYALSQQMIILETERLIARAPDLHADTLVRASLSLAAQQRSVRAEFVFMMGGELAAEVEQAAAGIGDLQEEDHIEADDEAIAGRLANQSRFALVHAIRSMSRASDALTRAALDEALVEERLALDQLQLAFSRTRYILRALTEREQLDLSRRLTGPLDEAARAVRPAARPMSEERVSALRGVLAGILAIAGSAEFGQDAASIAVAHAETLLRVDPSDAALQDIAAHLGEAAAAIHDGRAMDARAVLDRAATGLSNAVADALPDASSHLHTIELNRLDGARTDALRRPGGGS